MQGVRLVGLVVVFTAAPFGPGVARAETAGPTAAAAAGPASAPATEAAKSTKRPPKRPVPDYDGRGPAPKPPGSALLWVPRVLLFPLWVLTEYVVRRPLGWLLSTAEERRWPAIIIDVFTFGEERKAGLFPTALIDFGFRPSVGLYFFWNDFIARGNELRVRAATSGVNWLVVSAADRLHLAPWAALALRAEVGRRPDWRHYGLGPDATDEFPARFGTDRFETDLALDLRTGGVHLRARAGMRGVRFDPSRTCCGEPALAERIAAGELPAPPGFELTDEVAALYDGLELVADTRPPRPASRSGVRVALHVQHAARVGRGTVAFIDPPAYHWLRYGFAAGAFLDLRSSGRVLGLALHADFVDPLHRDGRDGPRALPFTELVGLGGAAPLRGFVQGWLLDRSAIALRLDYQWPVWTWLDGYLDLEVGNVFGPRLEDFSFDRLRLSFGAGVRSVGKGDNPFDLLFAIGTEPFAEGAHVTSFRFVMGTTRGF